MLSIRFSTSLYSWCLLRFVVSRSAHSLAHWWTAKSMTAMWMLWKRCWAVNLFRLIPIWRLWTTVGISMSSSSMISKSEIIQGISLISKIQNSNWISEFNLFRKTAGSIYPAAFFISLIFMQQLIKILYFHFHFQMYLSVYLSHNYLLKYR